MRSTEASLFVGIDVTFSLNYAGVYDGQKKVPLISTNSLRSIHAMDSQPKQKRRPRPRFSLRVLMLASVMICCGLAWWSSQTRRMLRQQRAVAEIRKLGGHAVYAHQLNGKPPPEAPALLRSVTRRVVMSPVVKVSWHAVQVSDEDTNHLSDLPKLNDLRLNSTRLSDAAMQPLSQLPNLQRLDLWCNQITDQSMPYLANMQRLRRLSLYSTQVTDQGLQFLEPLHHLEELSLRGTNVTPLGVERLQRKLPNCKISGI